MGVLRTEQLRVIVLSERPWRDDLAANRATAWRDNLDTNRRVGLDADSNNNGPVWSDLTTCNADPYWDVANQTNYPGQANALHGLEYEVDNYDPNGTTLLE